MLAMKTMVVFVVDVSPTMKNVNKWNQSKVDVCKTFIADFVALKMATSKTFEVGVISCGDDITSNYINDTQGGYENIRSVCDISKPSPDTFEALMSIHSCQGAFDFIDGVTVAQDYLTRCNSKYKYNRIVVVLTDGESEVDSSGFEFLEAVLSGIKDSGNCIHIGMLGKVTSDSSTTKRENSKFFESCCSTTGGCYLEGDSALNMFRMLSFAKGLGSRPQMPKISFELSSSLKIPCVYFSWVMKAKPLPLKKKSAYNNTVKRDTSYRNPSDPDLEVSFEDRIKGYRYGSQYVPLTPADEDAMKLESDPVIRLLGFLPQSKVCRHLLLDATFILDPATGVGPSQDLLMALSQALQKSQQYAIARFVKRTNSDPILIALSPTTDGGLMFHHIPCSEDMRDFSFSSLDIINNGDEMTRKKQRLMSNFLDSITLAHPPEDVIIPSNPSYLAVVEWLRDSSVAMAKGNAVKESSASPFLSCFSTTSVGYLDNATECQKLLRDLSESFELKRVVTNKEKKKNYWSEINISSSTTSANGHPSSIIPISIENPSLINVNTNVSIKEEVIEKLQINFSVSSLNPVNEFAEAIGVASSSKDSEALIGEIYDTMMQIIVNLVTKGGTNAHFRKALQSLKALRSSAICEGEHQRFNAFMVEKVKNFSKITPLKPFWELLVKEVVSLITMEEDSGSSISGDESRQFLREEVVKIEEAAPEIIMDEEEDLFANMA